jgi:hypothetical protein
MEAYRGRNGIEPVPVKVEIVASGIGRVPCVECVGKPQDFSKLCPPELGATQCIDVRGEEGLHFRLVALLIAAVGFTLLSGGL